MLKNLFILALSVVLSFGVGVVSVKHCPFVKKAVGDNTSCVCNDDKGGCCSPK